MAGAQKFDGRITRGPRGGGVVAVPFDPDELWGRRALHPVSGTIGGVGVRGALTRQAGGWVLPLGPAWLRDAPSLPDADVVVELAPEGPQRTDLADDVAAALDADPAAAACWDTLAQFYRKAYLRWIDGASRRPEVRAARISEVVGLLAAGVKQRPRPPGA